jgi:hypothetical protein
MKKAVKQEEAGALALAMFLITSFVTVLLIMAFTFGSNPIGV